MFVNIILDHICIINVFVGFMFCISSMQTHTLLMKKPQSRSDNRVHTLYYEKEFNFTFKSMYMCTCIIQYNGEYKIKLEITSSLLRQTKIGTYM